MGARVTTLEELSELQGGEPPDAVFCTAEAFVDQGAFVSEATASIILFVETIDVDVLSGSLNDARVVALVGTKNGVPLRDWELTYLARRLVAPLEEAPLMSDLLAWGGAVMSWTPANTNQLRTTVAQIERVCAHVGVERWQSKTVAEAAHELLMNAIYDAPRDAAGNALNAMDRTADVTLEPHLVPTLVFTVNGDLVALDVVDPNGGLSRRRYVQGVLRGQRNIEQQMSELDTSHGGAGLGLHSLFASGAFLRAEITPKKRTHVSWMLDRRVPKRGRRSSGRTLVFLPSIPADTFELAAGELSVL